MRIPTIEDRLQKMLIPPPKPPARAERIPFRIPVRIPAQAPVPQAPVAQVEQVDMDEAPAPVAEAEVAAPPVQAPGFAPVNHEPHHVQPEGPVLRFGEAEMVEVASIADLEEINEEVSAPLILSQFPGTIDRPAFDGEKVPFPTALNSATRLAEEEQYALERTSLGLEDYVGGICPDFRNLSEFDTCRQVYELDPQKQYILNKKVVKTVVMNEDTIYMKLFQERIRRDGSEQGVPAQLDLIKSAINSLRPDLPSADKVTRFHNIIELWTQLAQISPKYDMSRRDSTLSNCAKFGKTLTWKNLRSIRASMMVHASKSDPVRDENYYDLRLLLDRINFQYPDNAEFDTNRNEIVNLMNTARNFELAPSSARIRPDESLASIERAEAVRENRAEKRIGAVKMKDCPNCFGREHHEVFLDNDEKIRKQQSVCPFVCRACGISHGIGKFACYRLDTVSHPVEETIVQLRAALNDRKADGSHRYRVIFLTAPTGTGETTRVMEYLAKNLTKRNILVLTPRRAAVKSAYKFESLRLNYQLGPINNMISTYRGLEKSWAIIRGSSREQGLAQLDLPDIMSMHQKRIDQYNGAFMRCIDTAYTCSYMYGRSTNDTSRAPNSLDVKRNKLVYCTDGFAAEHIGMLSMFDIVVLDESHEATKDKELIAAALRQLMDVNPRGGPQVVIMSATLLVPDPNKLAETALGVRHFNVRPMAVQFEPTPHQPRFENTIFFAGSGDPMVLSSTRAKEMFVHIEHALYFAEHLRRQGYGATGIDRIVSGTLMRQGVKVVICAPDTCATLLTKF